MTKLKNTLIGETIHFIQGQTVVYKIIYELILYNL